MTAKGKQEPVPAWEALEARLALRRRRRSGSARAADRPRARARRARRRARPGPSGARAAARNPRRRAGDRQEPHASTSSPGAVESERGAHLLAAGPFASVRRRSLVLGARRDGEGPGGRSSRPTRPQEAAGKLQRSVGDLLDGCRRRLGCAAPGCRSSESRAEQELRGDHRTEAFAAWRRFFEAIAEERPLVLVFEDLHWADEGLLDFVDHLVDWAGGVPILVVCTARPELLTRRAGWGGGKPNAVTLSLSPLDDEQTARLLAALLERSVLPAETQAALLQRAGGNPLYAEEFVRMVADRDLAAGDARVAAARVGAGDRRGSPRRAARRREVTASGRGGDRQGVLAGRSGRDRAGSTGRPARSVYTGSNGRSSSVASGGRRLPGRTSTHFGTCSSATSRTARSLVLGEPRSIVSRPNGSRGLAVRRIMRSCSRTIIRARSSSRALRGADTTSLSERARIALREAGDRALALGAYPSAMPFYRDAVELWPHDDPGRPMLLFRYGQAMLLADGHERRSTSSSKLGTASSRPGIPGRLPRRTC